MVSSSSSKKTSNKFFRLRPMITHLAVPMCKLALKAAVTMRLTIIDPPDKSDSKPRHRLELAHHRPNSTSVRARQRTMTSISKSFTGQKTRRIQPIQRSIEPIRSSSIAAKSLSRRIIYTILQVTWKRIETASRTLLKKQTRRWDGVSSQRVRVVEFLAASSAAGQRTRTTDEIQCRNQRNEFNFFKETPITSKWPVYVFSKGKDPV